MIHKYTLVSEKRVQLYLPKEQYRGVLLLAHQKHSSFAQIVREAIAGFLQTNRDRWDHDPITDHIGMFEGKDTDLSVHHDRYIYEEK
jgi:hypothetical protein